MPASEKVCIGCGLAWPATTSYFHKSKDGFHARCRKCRNKKLRSERKGKRNAKLEEIEKGAVKHFVAVARVGGATIPHSSELLEVLMEYFGGVRGFANLYMKQFYDAPVGGAFRTKMLDSVMRLVTTNTAMGGAKKPLELMSEEELEAELRRQVIEAAMTMQKIEVVDEVRGLPVVDRAGAKDVGGVSALSAGDGNQQGGSVPEDLVAHPLRRVEPQE